MKDRALFWYSARKEDADNQVRHMEEFGRVRAYQEGYIYEALRMVVREGTELVVWSWYVKR